MLFLHGHWNCPCPLYFILVLPYTLKAGTVKWPGLTNSLFLSRSRRCFSSLKFVRTSIWPCNCMVNYDLSLQEMLVFSSNSGFWHSIWRASWYASNCVHFKKQWKFLIYFFNFVSTYIYLHLESFLISISIVGKVILDIIGHQGCIICSILPSGMGARGVSSEHVKQKMHPCLSQLFSCKRR